MISTVKYLEKNFLRPLRPENAGVEDMGTPSPYDAATDAWLAAIPAEPTDARKTLIDNLILDLKGIGPAATGSNQWQFLDRLTITAGHDGPSCLFDLVDPTKQGSAINSPVFTVDRGYAGGVAEYIDLNDNRSTDRVNETDTSMFILCANKRTAVGPTFAYLCGAYDNVVANNFHYLRIRSETQDICRAPAGALQISVHYPRSFLG